MSNSFQRTFQPVTTSGFTVADDNSSTAALTSSSVFTGTAQDALGYDSLVVAVATDQDGTLQVQFSTDGTNWDSTLTRYYRTARINAPHRYTLTRRYFRVVFTNTSASNQTYFRLQTLLGDKSELNATTDSTLPQDFDATVVRPTNFTYEVALGRRQGFSTWNKFGYNDDVDTGTEVLAAFGGTFTPLASASTLTIVSSSTDDDSGGIGANSVVISGVDENWDPQNEVVTLDGTTPVVTTTEWLGINRAAIYLAGTSKSNVGTLTITATTGGSTQATVPAGQGTTQQLIYFVANGHQALADWLLLNAEKITGGTTPKVTFKGWVFSAVSNAKYEVFRQLVDTNTDDHIELRPSQPLVFGEKSCFWIEATTTVDNTSVAGRFSLILARDADQ